MAIAMSPTMQCNLSCKGCYATDYPREDEMSLETIDAVLSSAEDLGVYAVVVTGGEPLLREGLLDLLSGHRRLVFLMITNGLLMDDATACKIARSGNIVPVVSLEGGEEQTDARRGAGVYEKALKAMELLGEHGGVFGFSTTVTRANWDMLSGEEFTEEMLARGCTLGYHTEYVPVGSDLDTEMVLGENERSEFRKRILHLRKTLPILLTHLPDDEYNDEDQCQGVAGGTVHINSQGYAEPCPFCHYASDNVRTKGLEEVINSRFLARLRSSKAIYRRTCIGCALVENSSAVAAIAAECGARPTTGPG